MDSPSPKPPAFVLSPPASSPPPSITAALARSASPTKAPVVRRSAINPYLYGCSDKQKATAIEAWTEAGTLADAHVQWIPPIGRYKGKWQPAQAMYLGDDSKNDDSSWGGGPLRQDCGAAPCDRRPELYSAKEVVDLARNENSRGAMRNEQSWTFAALAMYVQQTFKLPSPPLLDA
ncbi:hypothetical protein MMC22_004560 [Lobaria immixta]|nr:hypothetical protein [Lobaria immixta]